MATLKASAEAGSFVCLSSVAMPSYWAMTANIPCSNAARSLASAVKAFTYFETKTLLPDGLKGHPVFSVNEAFDKPVLPIFCDAATSGLSVGICAIEEDAAQMA